MEAFANGAVLAMIRAMPSPALLQAISRLELAVSNAETACATYLSAQKTVDDKRRAEIQSAIQEIDELIHGIGNAPAESAPHG